MLIATVSGNLGRDATMRDAGGTTVCSFGVASTGKVKGEKVTTWVDVSVWGRRGEVLSQYLTKGTRVVVVGELSTREHNGKTYLQLRADQVDLMGGGQQGGSRQSSGASGGGYQDEDYGADDSDLPF